MLLHNPLRVGPRRRCRMQPAWGAAPLPLLAGAAAAPLGEPKPGHVVGGHERVQAVRQSLLHQAPGPRVATKAVVAVQRHGRLRGCRGRCFDLHMHLWGWRSGFLWSKPTGGQQHMQHPCAGRSCSCRKVAELRGGRLQPGMRSSRLPHAAQQLSCAVLRGAARAGALSALTHPLPLACRSSCVWKRESTSPRSHSKRSLACLRGVWVWQR
jgi:hypothetical protein